VGDQIGRGIRCKKPGQKHNVQVSLEKGGVLITTKKGENRSDYRQNKWVRKEGRGGWCCSRLEEGRKRGDQG